MLFCTECHSVEGSLSLEDFIARLEEVLGRMRPPSEGLDILLKQLAWENANAFCQQLIRQIRKIDCKITSKYA